MDLFEAKARDRMRAEAPLAERLRPATLDDMVGQGRLLGKTGPLRGMIETDRFPSMILWGPPGSGKTTLARVIAHTTRSRFIFFSAVEKGLPEFRRIVREARDAAKFRESRTILFVDEVHRLNKAQQDAFLPHVESGLIKLIGATTENPAFEVISALLSRCRVFTLQPLSREELEVILERGLRASGLVLHPDARDRFLDFAAGDARTLLNQVEALAGQFGTEEVTVPMLEKALQKKALRYDKGGEEHYNVISAFVKSMRGSDPDAALYWLARMLEAGEDPVFIARRMVIFASEDIGLADPAALGIALAVKEAVRFVGMPEARINLAHGAAFLAAAQKSNRACRAMERALDEVGKSGPLPVPLRLRNTAETMMKKAGYGDQDAHDLEGAKGDRRNLPDAIRGKKFFS